MHTQSNSIARPGIRYLVLTLIAGLSLMVYAETAAGATASDIMAGMAAKMSAPSVEAQFTVSEGSNSMQGSIRLAGACFALDTPQLKVWYDGTTQWTLLVSASEVTVTEPTPDELLAANPLAILRNYSSAYNVRRLADRNGCRRVELIPRTPCEIARVKITVAPDSWPRSIEITFDDGRRITARVDHIAAGASLPAETFRFNPARYNFTELIDLR